MSISFRSVSMEFAEPVECPCCLEPITSDGYAHEPAHPTPGKIRVFLHYHHKECIAKWLETHNNCPSCTIEVSKTLNNYTTSVYQPIAPPKPVAPLSMCERLTEKMKAMYLLLFKKN